MSNVHDQLRTIEATARTLDATVAAHEAAFDPTVYMHADGSVVATGDMDLGGFDIDNVGKILIGTSIDTGTRLQVVEDSSITNAVTQVLRLTSTSSGTPANGIGVGLELECETTAGNEVGATIECSFSDVSAGSEDADLVFKLMSGGSAAVERFKISSNGDVNITRRLTFFSGGFGGEAIKISNSDTINFDLSDVRAKVFRASATTNRLEFRGSSNATRFLSSASAELLTLTDAGDLGIGTDSPTSPLHVEKDSSTTSAVTQVLRMTSTSSGTPANGIGVGMEFEVECAAGNEVGAMIECVVTDVSSGSEDFDLVFKTMVAGVSADPRLTLSATTSALMTHHGTAVGNGFDCNDAHIGTWIGSVNFAYFGHKAVKATAGSYSMLAQNDGATYLNAASTKLIDFRINNVTTMHMGANALHFADNKGVYLGTGDDAAVYYDGSNVIVDPKVVGSGKITVPGSVYVADGFATAGSSRNAHITCWSDEAFGMELSGIGGAPCLLVYGRATDTDAIKFGTYTANSTAQSNFTQRAVLTSAGGLGVGVSAPAAGKVDALGGFADNGTAGIDKTFSFSDGAFQTHSVIISGGIITQWNIA